MPARPTLFMPLVLSILISMALSGCSDMKFVGKTNLVPEKDPREDIVLTNISTMLTSGGLVQQKVGGSSAVFSNTSNDLTIKDIGVVTFGVDRTTQSITTADVGQVYFAADPKRNIGRKDMRFAGDVLYRNPQKDDPSTDSLQMRSEVILWDQGKEKFISPTGYEMVLFPKGQRPVRQTGKSFEAGQSLTRFVVKAGSVSTKDEPDPAGERARLMGEFEKWKTAADSEVKKVNDMASSMTLIKPNVR